MPIFFLLSGYCSKLHRKEVKFFPYLIKHIKTLLIPCFIFKVILILTKISVFEYWSETVTALFFSPTLEWFCPVLFLSGIVLWFYHLIVKRLESLTNSKIIILLLLITFIGIVPSLVHFYAEQGYHGTEPLIVRLDSCLIATSFVLLGYHLYEMNALQRIKTAVLDLRKGSFVVLIVLLFGVSAPFIYNNSYVNVYDASLGKSDLLFYYLALLGSFYCIAFSCKIVSMQNSLCDIIKNTLIFMGRHSLYFYFGHGIVFQMYHKILIRFFNKDWWPMADQWGIRLKTFYFLSSIVILIPLLKMWDYILLRIKERLQYYRK